MPRNSNIRAVALTVKKQILNGERPNVSKAMIANGYAISTANKQPQTITRHPDYKAVEKTFLQQLENVQNIAIDIIEKKKSRASFRDGIEALDKAKKLEFLITGEKPTEAIAVKWME